MVAISRAPSLPVMPSALRAVTDWASRRLRFSNKLGRGFSVLIEFGEHQGMERVMDRGCDFGRDDAVSLGVDEQNASGGTKVAQGLGNPYLIGAARKSVFGFHLRPEAGSAFQPLDVIVDGIAHERAGRQRFEEFLRQALSTMDAGVDVVTLLEIDVLEKIAADRSHRDRIAEHLDAGKVRDYPFCRHQAIAQVFVDAWSSVEVAHPIEAGLQLLILS